MRLRLAAAFARTRVSLAARLPGVLMRTPFFAKVLLAGLLLTLALAGVLALALAHSADWFTPAPKLEDLGEVHDFSLTERSGATIQRDDLLGKVWVASFIFTRCTGQCP